MGSQPGAVADIRLSAEFSDLEIVPQDANATAGRYVASAFEEGDRPKATCGVSGVWYWLGHAGRLPGCRDYDELLGRLERCGLDRRFSDGIQVSLR